ncbi:MAG: hypothetical protein ACRD03_00690 [Acidimicrobiales bacterium]
MADALTAALIAPDGTRFDTSNGAVLTRTPFDLVLRLDLPAPPSTSTGGQWRVRLAVDRRRLRKILAELKQRDDGAGLNRLERHGVEFTVTVQARSNVPLSVTTTRASRRPGGAAGQSRSHHHDIPISRSHGTSSCVDAFSTTQPRRCDSAQSEVNTARAIDDAHAGFPSCAHQNSPGVSER